MDLFTSCHLLETSAGPVLFDPAVHYGDRESDLAMSELFGGFARGFYLAYAQDFPLFHGQNIWKAVPHIIDTLRDAGRRLQEAGWTVVETPLPPLRAPPR